MPSLQSCVRLVRPPWKEIQMNESFEPSSSLMNVSLKTSARGSLNRPGFRDCSGYCVTASRAGAV